MKLHHALASVIRVFNGFSTLALVGALFVSLHVRHASAQGAGEFERAFNELRYDQCLTIAEVEMKRWDDDKLNESFHRAVALAIALERIEPKNPQLDEKIAAVLQRSPDAVRFFETTRKLLRGEVAPAGEFFKRRLPNYTLWGAQTAVLRKHGFELAANVFAALYMTGSIGLAGNQSNDAIQAGIAGWLAVPTELREQLTKILLVHFQANWFRRNQVVRELIQLIDRSPNPTIQQAAFNLARYVDVNREILTPTLAIEMTKSPVQKQYGVMIALEHADLHMADHVVQTTSARFMEAFGSDKQLQDFYSKRLASSAEPFVRDMRMEHLRLKQQRRGFEMNEAAKERFVKFELADQAMLDKKYVDAYARYLAIFTQADLGLESRLDAAAGLIQSNPERFLQEFKFDVFNAASRPQIHWLASKLWIVTDLQIKELSEKQPLNATVPACPQWLPLVAKWTDAAVEVAPVECLRGDLRTGYGSLRVPLAMMYQLIGEQEKASDVLKKPVTYLLPPPAGGWKGPPGTPTPPDANQPKTVTSPSASELKDSESHVRFKINFYMKRP